MAIVEFFTSLGGDGSRVSDDTDPVTGLRNGGQRIRFVPALIQVVAIAGFVVTKAAEAAASAVAAAASKTQADTLLSNAQAASSVIAAAALNSANNASVSAQLAQSYASVAQAVSPDSPIRLNQRIITADFSVASNYNAVSAGPLEIAEGITVTINDFANWSIV